MATTGQDLTLRPMRAADRDRVMEISRDIWDGHDYLPRVFDVALQGRPVLKEFEPMRDQATMWESPEPILAGRDLTVTIRL